MGVIFFVLWWIPFWLLGPIITRLSGDQNNSSAQHKITLAIIIIQTIFGILGAVIAGREVIKILRHTPYKKAPKSIWNILTSGSIENKV